MKRDDYFGRLFWEIWADNGQRGQFQGWPELHKRAYGRRACGRLLFEDDNRQRGQQDWPEPHKRACGKFKR